jgi:hypothetical protein
MQACLLCFSASSESVFLTKHQSGHWDIEDVDENSRIELPLPVEAAVSGCLGIAFDFLDTKQLPADNPDDPPLPVAPICNVLTTDGTVIAYHLVGSSKYLDMRNSVNALEKPTKSEGLKVSSSKQESSTSAKAFGSLEFGGAPSVKPLNGFGFGASVAAQKLPEIPIEKPIEKPATSFGFGVPTLEKQGIGLGFGALVAAQKFDEKVTNSAEISADKHTISFGISAQDKDKSVSTFGNSVASTTVHSVEKKTDTSFKFGATHATSTIESDSKSSKPDSDEPINFGTPSTVEKKSSDMHLSKPSLASTSVDESAQLTDIKTSISDLKVPTLAAKLISEKELFVSKETAVFNGPNCKIIICRI